MDRKLRGVDWGAVKWGVVESNKWVLAGRACVGRVAWSDMEVCGWAWLEKVGLGGVRWDGVKCAG